MKPSALEITGRILQASVFQNIAADYHALHFACALIDLCDLGIAHQALHMVSFPIAITTVNLNGFYGSLHGYFAREQFCHRAGARSAE